MINAANRNTEKAKSYRDAVYGGIPEGYEAVVSEENWDGRFSWSPCELCGSHLAGDRHLGALIMPGTSLPVTINIDICVDCLAYLANGDLPENWAA